nr:MAG TPA: HAD-hyrolase-like [Bacteriophage sp.]
MQPSAPRQPSPESFHSLLKKAGRKLSKKYFI